MLVRDNSKDLVEQLKLATQRLAAATEKLRHAKYSGSNEMLLSVLADDVIRHSHVAMELNMQLEPPGTSEETPTGTS